MEISLIANPYDLGREREGMGAGPVRYLDAGVEDALSEEGLEVGVETVRRRGPFEDEQSATADVNARLAERVGAAVARGSFPLVLGGNCDSALGSLAGIGTAGVGIVWFDAHGDFNTPETSTSGYLGGMPLAIATGHCHEELWNSAGNGDSPVPESNVLMVGVRDVEEEQRPRLERSGISVIGADTVNAEGVEKSLPDPLTDLRSRVDEIYLHLDVDSLDPRYAPGVDFPAPGGLSVDDVEETIRMIAHSFRIGAATLTAYNPDKDQDHKTLETGIRLIKAVAVTGVEREGRRVR